jgi:hypothetical protein
MTQMLHVAQQEPGMPPTVLLYVAEQACCGTKSNFGAGPAYNSTAGACGSGGACLPLLALMFAIAGTLVQIVASGKW